MFITKNVSIFTSYINQKRNDHSPALSLSPPHDYKSRNTYPLKMHISLTFENYKVHKEQIVEILIEHLEMDTCYEFKTINDERFKAELIKIEKAKELISLFKNFQNSLPFDQHRLIELHNCFFEPLINHISAIGKHHIENCIRQLEEFSDSALRFQSGDQFTIYFPYQCDFDKVYILCSMLRNYFIEHQVLPGTKSDVSAIVAPHLRQLNLRSEYLHLPNSVKKIEALPTEDESTTERFLLKKQTETHPLCQFLKKRMRFKEKNPSQLNMFYNINSPSNHIYLQFSSKLPRP